jgi:hypothetical protein
VTVEPEGLTLRTPKSVIEHDLEPSPPYSNLTTNFFKITILSFNFGLESGSFPKNKKE